MSLQTRLATMGITIDTMQFPGTSFRYPVVGLIFYLLTIAIFSPDDAQIQAAKAAAKARKQEGKAERFGLVRIAMLLHNALLCVFSALCFYHTLPVVLDVYGKYGWTGALKHGMYNAYDGPFGYWSWLFYLSKYYEFIDSWIVIARGRRPIFLQVYHHTGAVLGMWLLVTTRSPCSWIFVCFNSFIHTIMYFYYCLSVLKVPVKAKFVITLLQITQFVVGLSMASLFVLSRSMHFEGLFATVFNMIYVSVLFVLFVQFYKSTYNKKKGAKKSALKKEA